MKIGELVHWNHHYGAIYKIVDINKQSGMLQIENYVNSAYISKYWTYEKHLQYLTEEEIAKLIARKLTQ